MKQIGGFLIPKLYQSPDVNTAVEVPQIQRAQPREGMNAS